jgi:formylglycine-generating enzyme required for sulfatase activity
MKKLFPILVALAIISSACQLGGGEAQPTAIALPTAVPTNTPVAAIPTSAPVAVNAAVGTTRTSADGMTEVFVPQGSVQMGGIDSAASGDEKPVHKVSLPAYWIDKLEVTNAMYLGCITAGGCQPPQAIKSETRPAYFNNPDFNDFPVIYVTWGEAAAYCKWAGRRLPTEAEWERAARGDDVRTYPWGSTLPDSTTANFNYQFGDTNRVGSYPAGASPFGALDMAGNVAEWVNDYYSGTYYSQNITSNPQGPIARANFFGRVVRGGSFGDSQLLIRVSKRSNVNGGDPNALVGSDANNGDSSPRIGFRCAANN